MRDVMGDLVLAAWAKSLADPQVVPQVGHAAKEVKVVHATVQGLANDGHGGGPVGAEEVLRAQADLRSSPRGRGMPWNVNWGGRKWKDRRRSKGRPTEEDDF